MPVEHGCHPVIVNKRSNDPSGVGDVRDTRIAEARDGDLLKACSGAGDAAW